MLLSRKTKLRTTTERPTRSPRVWILNKASKWRARTQHRTRFHVASDLIESIRDAQQPPLLVSWFFILSRTFINVKLFRWQWEKVFPSNRFFLLSSTLSLSLSRSSFILRDAAAATTARRVCRYRMIYRSQLNNNVVARPRHKRNQKEMEWNEKEMRRRRRRERDRRHATKTRFCCFLLGGRDTIRTAPDRT